MKNEEILKLMREAFAKERKIDPEKRFDKMVNDGFIWPDGTLRRENEVKEVIEDLYEDVDQYIRQLEGERNKFKRILLGLTKSLGITMEDAAKFELKDEEK